MQYMKKYIRKYGVLFTFSVLLVSGEAFVDLLQPTIMARIVDEGVASRDMDIVLRLGGWMLFITAIGAICASSRNIVSSWVSQRFGSELREELFEKIQRLSFAQIDRFDRASLVTRLTNDVTQVQNFVNGMMRVFVKAPLLGIGGIIMAFRLNPYLSLVLVVVIPIVGLLIVMNMRVGFPLFLKVQTALDKLNSAMREYLSGVRVVKAFNRFDYEVDKFNDINQQYEKRSIRAQRLMALFSPGVTFAMNVGIVAVIWLGGIRVNVGNMQVGHIIAFVNYMTQILFSLTTMTMITNMFVRAKASTGRITEVLAEKDGMESNAVDGRSSSSKYRELQGAIEFDRVSFSYEGADGEPALKTISFRCEPGETVAIIGSTGSGKSSLIHLIPRFYDVTSGALRIDGVDVREMEVEELRERIALVPQQSILFTGKVADNIRIGKPDATMEEIEEAAVMASAHDFISKMPEGYSTLLGQGGVNFSGGQKQRVSIARALIRKPDILLLDDCTSALDSKTEASIKQSIRQFAGQTTTLLVAQRISSVRDADKIIVLDDGEIVGSGTHDELMADCGVYQEIYRSQIGKEAGSHAG
ncbi:ABC transporter ATP-binding protein [Paenibacillus radicis (ex Gao et al. 2016)]|uniref:ABC transporter n=1 Tax=Paenibacillus radicis (ex Gao et al. 2016) TaxID=1737354 RepID=A0A917M1Q3_9BACL|nr:ABC transporter ATP-binding protein [Paenibacillus radicis (ex Gao et al. 2016)]GGG71132.1 ABC transporter [Paenibacillus radicis (ex Gao et al. 2016)]